VEHEYVPEWQASTMQDPPAVHAAHEPALQTMLVPHDVPLAVFVRLAQVCEPVAHEFVPDWQALPDGLQAPPAVQLTHDPLLQTWLVPQDVPSALFVKLLQVSVPELQEFVPT
jgi:hypothetical protein